MFTNHRHKLTLDTNNTADRVWVQIAAAGDFNGYAGGTVSFQFDAKTFEQIVANFRRHPSYRGGTSDVIAWDFHHASETHASEGTVPTSGAPAQGWVQELAVRRGADGEAELWALTRWLEPAKTYIKEERYSWASVSVIFDAVDARTGRVIGPVLTSVALTNQPFIEGMQRLAASKYQKGNPTMTTTDRLIAALPTYEANSPNRAAALERAVLDLVPEAKTLPRHVLFERFVHPALAQLRISVNVDTQTGHRGHRSRSPGRSVATLGFGAGL